MIEFDQITFKTAPAKGAVITIKYTCAVFSPYFTFGSRLGNVLPYSSSFGKDNEASGLYSSAFGFETKASGFASVAQNTGTVAKYAGQTVVGQYNEEAPAHFIVGSGISDKNRHNALEVYSNRVKINSFLFVDNIFFNDYSSPLGTMRSNSPSSAVSVPSGTSTGTDITSLTLSPGKWIISGRIGYDGNATGNRWLCISTTSKTSSIQVSSPACTGGSYTFLSHTLFANITASTTYYLVGMQNSGSALNARTTSYLSAIKIV